MNLAFKVLISIFFLILTFSNTHPALADWTTDITPPTCTINFDPLSSQVTGTSVTVTVRAFDENSPIVTSLSVDEIDEIAVTLSDSGATRTYIWSSTTAGSHSFVAGAQDRIGNPSSCTNSFTLIAATCADAQTCPTTCHTTDTTVPNGDCGATLCKATNRTAESCPTNICHSAYTYYTGQCNANGTDNSEICVATNNCPSGQICNNGTCNYSAWIQVTGDVHSNTGINAPGGP